MPWILSFLASAGVSFMSWAVEFFTKKVRVISTTIAGFILITAALVLCVKKAVAVVMALAVIPTWLVAGVGMLLPYNFALVLSSIMGARSCRWAYDVAVAKLKMVNSGT